MNRHRVLEQAPEPVTSWRAECNRLVLEAAVRAYDRRHGRTSRRQPARTQDPSAASRGAAQEREASAAA